MYLVFNGNNYTPYNMIFEVFYSFDKALVYASDLIKQFSDVEYDDEYVKTRLKEAYNASERVFGIRRGTFYCSSIDGSFIGIEYIRVGDMKK